MDSKVTKTDFYSKTLATGASIDLGSIPKTTSHLQVSIFPGVELLYNVVLASALQHCEILSFLKWGFIAGVGGGDGKFLRG